MKLLLQLMSSIHLFEDKFCRHIHKSDKTWGPFEYVMAIFAATFNNELASFIWAFALLFMHWSIKSAVACAALPAITFGFTIATKRAFRRDRPKKYEPRAEQLKYDFRGQERNHSMPSGDSAQAAAF